MTAITLSGGQVYCDFEFDYGPDSDRETALKEALADLDRRYRDEAKPLRDELAGLYALKAPTVRCVRPSHAIGSVAD